VNMPAAQLCPHHLRSSAAQRSSGMPQTQAQPSVWDAAHACHPQTQVPGALGRDMSGAPPATDCASEGGMEALYGSLLGLMGPGGRVALVSLDLLDEAGLPALLRVAAAVSARARADRAWQQGQCECDRPLAVDFIHMIEPLMLCSIMGVVGACPVLVAVWSTQYTAVADP
jgi:hypothetical protein